MSTYDAFIPVNILTGFLGSGKTTLLGQLLRSPELRDTAVLVNEFGEVGLDHHLLEQVDEETVLLNSGCLCCTIRGDLNTALRGLFSRRERGEIPPFRRVVVETTGLADPVPIAFTLLSEPVLQHHFRLGNIVTTLDAVNLAGQLATYPESRKQAAVADRLVLTKTDLVEAGALAGLRARIREVNRSAPLLLAQDGPPDPRTLLMHDLYSDEGKLAELNHLMAQLEGEGGDAAHAHAPNVHDGPSGGAGGIHTFALTYARPLDWTRFGIWLTLLLHTHGEKVLRVKGILNVDGLKAPVAIHGVQHLVHPPTHMLRWPSGERHSRIVFIVHGLPREAIEHSLRTFMEL